MNSFDELGTVFFSKQTLPDVFAFLILSVMRKDSVVATAAVGRREGVTQLSRVAGDE